MKLKRLGETVQNLKWSWANFKSSFLALFGVCLSYEQMREALRAYNWDDGFNFPQTLLENPLCDLAMALEIFERADGFAYFNYPREELPEWIEFIQPLYESISAGKYVKTSRQYKNPCTSSQKYCLWRDGVSEVFFTDLP